MAGLTIDTSSPQIITDVDPIRDTEKLLIEAVEKQDKNRPWRVLHVEDDRVFALAVGFRLKPLLPAGSTIDQAGSLKEGIDLLAQSKYDVVILDLLLPDSQGQATLRKIVSQKDAPPVLVLSGMENSGTAMDSLHSGASDFMYKSRLNSQFLAHALEKTVGRSLTGDQPSASAPEFAAERGSADLHALVRPAVIWPIEADGSPGQEIAATTTEISGKRIALLAEQPPKPLGDMAVVGVEHADTHFRYVTVQWASREVEGSRLKLMGVFVGRAADPFYASKLTPQFDSQQLTIGPALAEETLQQWTVRGMVRATPIDRLKTCPRCNALPTFRDGCPECGSGRTVTSQLIHHFACAHVAPISEFEKGGLVCPKCRARNLIVGVDFEHLEGPYRCVECGWSDTAPTLIGECIRCGLRFNGREAQEKDVVQYHVDHLDPLALVADAQ